MTTPLFSIGGLASGLDTVDIVQQLMALERQPMVNIQQRQDTLRRTDEVWSGILSRLSGLRSAADALRDPAALAGTTKVTSSNDGVAAVSRTGAAQPGALAFTVERLASNHRVALGGTFSSIDQELGAGRIALTTAAGELTEVELGEGATLSDAVRALNRADGVSASVLRTGDGEYRLIVTADRSGAAASFTVDTDLAPLAGAAQVLTQGADARLRIGDPALGGLTVTRQSNTFTDLIDGVEVRLTGLGEVTVGVQQDVDAAAGKVTKLVEQLNAVLDHLATVSRSSAEAGERGLLAGDPLVRSLQLELRGAMSQVTADGAFRTLGQVGVELTRDGRITLDQARLRDALSADPHAVGDLLGRVGQGSDPRVSVTATGRAQAGEYQVELDQAARVARATGATFSPPNGDPSVYSLVVNGVTVTVTADADDDAATIVRKLNDQLGAASVAVQARLETDDADQPFLVLEATRAGAAANFTVAENTEVELPDGAVHVPLVGVAIDTASDPATAGADAGGTIARDGESWALSGAGATMTVPTGAGQGLVFQVPTGVTGDLGTLRVADGLTGILDRVLQRAEGRDGSIARAREAIDGRIRAADDSLKAFEQRLELRERTIRRQFTAMESAMAQFSAQANWLASQLSSMMG